MELVVFVESTLVGVLTVSSMPCEVTLLANTISIIPFETIAFSIFNAMTMESIVTETTNVLNCWSLIASLRA